MASPGEDGAMEVDEPCSEFTSTEDVKSEEKPESKDETSAQAAATNAAIHLMLGSAFGMKVPPPEYSGIPQITPEKSPENTEVKLEEGQGDSMIEIAVEKEPPLPYETKPPKNKSKRKKNRAQGDIKDDSTIMPLISAPPSIVSNPPSRITGPIELDEDDFNKNDREKNMGRYSGGRSRGRMDDRGHSEDRGRLADDRRIGDDRRRGEEMDDDDHSPGRGPWRRPRHGKYKYPDDFDEEDFEDDFGDRDRDYGRDYDDGFGPPYDRGRPGPPGRDFGPGPRPYGQRPNFPGPPHGHHGPPGPPGYGPRNFGPDGPYGPEGHGNYGPHGYGPGPMMGPRGPPPMGPVGPPMGPGGPPMGPGGPPLGPGGPPMGPGNFPPHGYGMGPGPPQGPGYQGPPGPPGPGFPPPPQGPWQGEGFPPPPQTNFNMPNIPQPPQTFSGEVFHGEGFNPAFQGIPPPEAAAAKPQIAQESAEKLIAMGMNPDLAKILDADNKSRPRSESSGGTPKKKSKKKKKKGDSERVSDEQSFEFDEVPLPMSIPLPDDVPLPPEPKKKKKKKRDKDLENVMFPPPPDAVQIVGPAPKPATPPIPVLQPEQPVSSTVIGSADMPQLPAEASSASSLFQQQHTQSNTQPQHPQLQSYSSSQIKAFEDQPPLPVSSSLHQMTAISPAVSQGFSGQPMTEVAQTLPISTHQQLTEDGISGLPGAKSLGQFVQGTTQVTGQQAQLQQISQGQVLGVAATTPQQQVVQITPPTGNQQIVQSVSVVQIPIQTVTQPSQSARRSRFDPNWTPQPVAPPAVVSITPLKQTNQVPVVSQQETASLAQVSKIQQQQVTVLTQAVQNTAVIQQQEVPVLNILQAPSDQQVQHLSSTIPPNTMKSEEDVPYIEDNQPMPTKDDAGKDESAAMETDESETLIESELKFSEDQVTDGEGYLYYENKSSVKEESALESQTPKEPVTASQLLEKFKQKRQLKKTDSKTEFTKFPVVLPTPLSQQTSVKDEAKAQDKGQGKFTFAIRKLKQLEAEKEEEEKQVLTALSTEEEQKKELSYREIQKESSSEKREKHSKEKDLEGKSKSLFKERRKKSKSVSPDQRSLSRSDSRERKKYKKQRSISHERSKSRERKKSRERSRSRGRRSKSRERSISKDQSKRRDRSLSPWRKDREFFKRYGRFPRPGEADSIKHESNTSRERGRFSDRSNERVRPGRNQGSRRSRERSIEKSWEYKSRERERESRDRKSRERDAKDEVYRERDSKDRRSREKSRERISKERGSTERDRRGGAKKDRKHIRDSEDKEVKQSRDRKSKEKDRKKKKQKHRKDESSSRSDSSSSNSDSEEEKRKSRKKKKERNSRSSSEGFQRKEKDRNLSVDKKKSRSRDKSFTLDIEKESVVVKTEPTEEMETDVKDNLFIETADKKGRGIFEDYDRDKQRFSEISGDNDNNVEMETSDYLTEEKRSEKQKISHSSSSEDEKLMSKNSWQKRALTPEEKDKLSRQYSEDKEISRQYEKEKYKDKDRGKERITDDSDGRLKSYKDDRRAVRDDTSDFSRNERSRHRDEEDRSSYKRGRNAREDRYRETKEEKYKRDYEQDKDKEGKRYDRRDEGDFEKEREGRRKYKDYDSDSGDNYKSSRKDDSRQRRHEDRPSRAELVEHSVAKSKWDSGSESGDDYEKTHNEELLPARSSSGTRSRKEDASSKNLSGTVKLEIDISKINQLKLLNKMMKAKQQRESLSDQSSDSSDENDSKSKRKQKKDKSSKKKTKKERRHADSESENDDSPIKQKKKKKSKKKKKNDDYDSDEDGSQKKDKRKHSGKHASSDSDSSDDETKLWKRYKESKKLKKYESESDESLTRSKKSKDKLKKVKEKRYESSDEYEYKKKGSDKRTKKSQYQSDSEEEKIARRIKDKPKEYKETEKKTRDKYTKQDIFQQSEDETRYHKEREKQKRRPSRESESMDDDKDYSRQRYRSKEKQKKEIKGNKKSKKGKRHSEESELSDDDVQRRKRNRKPKAIEQNDSESNEDNSRKKRKDRSDSDDDYRRKKGKSKERQKYNSDDSDDKLTEVTKGIKKYKEHHSDKDSDVRKKKRSPSNEKEEKGYSGRKQQRSDPESDTNIKGSVSSSKERKLFLKEKILEEEKRSLSKEKRNLDDFDTGKLRKRSRSPDSQSKSRSRSRSKVFKLEKKRERNPSDSDSGEDQSPRHRDDSSSDEKRSRRKYEERQRSRDRESRKRSEKKSVSPRTDDRYARESRSSNWQEKEVNVKDRRNKDRDESYDEDYRSRKKREVDKEKRRYSSSKSGDSSSSSSSSESDIEKRRKHSKQTGQKNVKAGTGSKMGPVPGTPQTVENTDIEEANISNNNLNEEGKIDKEECETISDANVCASSRGKLNSEIPSVPSDNSESETDIFSKDEKLSKKHSKKKDKKEKEKKKHKKKKKKKKKKSGNNADKTDKLNSSTDSFRSVNKEDKDSAVFKDSEKPPEEKEKSDFGQESRKSNLNQSRHKSLLVDYASDIDSSSPKEVSKEKVNKNIPELLDNHKEEPMETDQCRKPGETMAQSQKAKARISFRLSGDTDTSTNLNMSEDEVKTDIEKKNVSEDNGNNAEQKKQETCKADLYDPFEHLNNSSESDSEEHNNKSDLFENVARSKSEKPLVVSSQSSMFSSKTLPDIGINTSVSNLNVQPVVYPFQALHSVIAPVPAPVGVPAPSNHQQSIIQNVVNPPSTIAQQVLPSSHALNIPPPTVTIPSLGVIQRSIDSSTKEQTNTSSVTSDKLDLKYSGSDAKIVPKLKQVQIKTFIPNEKDKLKTKIKSRWDTDDQKKAEQENNPDNDDLYDPFSVDSDSTPLSSPKVEKHRDIERETTSVKGKDADLDSTDLVVEKIPIPDEIGESVNQQAFSFVPNVAAVSNVHSSSQRTEGQKITMKFTTGRKIIGKSAIMVEDVEETDELSQMPKLKLSTHAEEITVSENQPAKKSFYETKKALKKSIQAAEVIEKQLEKTDTDIEMNKDEECEDKKIIHPIKHMSKVRSNSMSKEKSKSRSRERHRSLSKERDKSKTREANVGYNYKRSVSKERGRSGSRDIKGKAHHNRSVSKDRERSLSHERFQSTYREKTRDRRRRSYSRDKQKGKRSSRDRSLSREHKCRSETRERRTRRSSSHGRTRHRSNSRERRKAKSKTPDKHSNRSRRSLDDRHERNASSKNRRRKVSKSRSKSSSTDRDKKRPRKRTKQRKGSSSGNESSDSSDVESSSSASDDEDSVVRMKRHNDRTSLDEISVVEKGNKKKSENFNFEKVALIRSDSVDGSEQKNLLKKSDIDINKSLAEVGLLESESSEKITRISPHRDEKNDFIDVDAEISFKLSTSISTVKSNLDSPAEQEAKLTSSTAEQSERSNLFEQFSPVKIHGQLTNVKASDDFKDNDKGICDDLEGSWGQTPTGLFKYSPKKKDLKEEETVSVEKLYDLSKTNVRSESSSFFKEKEQLLKYNSDEDENENVQSGREEAQQEPEPINVETKRLTRKQAAAQNVSLPPVMSRDMPSRGRKEQKLSLDDKLGSESPVLNESEKNLSSFDQIKTINPKKGRISQNDKKQDSVQDVPTKHILTEEILGQKQKSKTSTLSTEVETPLVPVPQYQTEIVADRIEDIPIPTSSIDENENTVGSKTSKSSGKLGETSKETIETVDMELDEPEETPQKIEIVQMPTDKDLKHDIKVLVLTDKKPSEELRKEEAKRLLQETFLKDSVKGFSLKLQPNVLKKPKKKLTSQMLEDVFDTESSLSVKPKMSFKLSDDPIKPLSFGPPEFHILPKPPILTTAVASFKPLSEERNSSSNSQHSENVIEVIGPTNLSAGSSQSDNKSDDKKKEEVSSDENVYISQHSAPSTSNVQIISESAEAGEALQAPHSEEVRKAENILKTSQISPEQIGKAIQVIGQENLRRLEVLQRSAKLLQGKKIEVVGQRVDTTKVTASTHVSGSVLIHSHENPSFERSYDEADLGQLEQEKQELLKKLHTQDTNPGLDLSSSFSESPVFHGQIANSQSSDGQETESSIANLQRDFERSADKKYRRDDDFEDRRDNKGHRDRRKSRESRSRERSRDRDTYRGRDRGRSRDRSRERDRSRDRRRKKRFREEDKHRPRRRSRSWSKDRRSRSRDRRSRSRDRRSRSRDRRSRSRGRDRRSRSRDRRSRSRDRRSRSKDRRKSRRSRSRSRNRRSRSHSRDRDKRRDKPKSEKPKKESALEKFEKELAEKKKVLLQPVGSSPVLSSVSHPIATPASQQHHSLPDASNQFMETHGQYVQADLSSAPHFLPQPFPVHQQNMPMFPSMPEQPYSGFPADPNIFQPQLMGPQQQPTMGPHFYPEGIPPHMMQVPMPPGPPQPFPLGPGFGPGIFPPGPHQIDPNMMPIHHSMSLDHGQAQMGQNSQMEGSSGPPHHLVGPPLGQCEDGMHQKSFGFQPSGYHQSGQDSRPSFEHQRHLEVKPTEPEEEYNRTPIPDFNEEDEEQLEFKHGFGGPGIPGHPNLRQVSKNEDNENASKENKRRKKRVSRFEPRQEDLVTIEPEKEAELDIKKPEFEEKLEETKKFDEVSIAEKSLEVEDHTGFGKWEPVIPVKSATISKFEDGSEPSEGQNVESEKHKAEFVCKPDEGAYDEGTPQSQSEDMSDSDVGVGKPIKVKSRWRRASEAETPPPPPPPSKKFGNELVKAEKAEDDEAIPIDFELIDENIYLAERKRSKQMREVRRMVCDCSTCKEDREMGYDACGEDCLNRMLFIECGSKCPCGEYCTNKRFQKRQNATVTPFRTDWKGYGLKALEDLEPGEFVMEYVGEVLDYQLFKKRSKQYSKAGQQHFYFMAINPEEIVDATVKGNISRFINHSCDPNCETQKWTVNGTLRVGFFVRKPIKKGEEITFDYKYEVYGKEAQKCFCGTDICRGWLGGDKRMELRSTRRSISVDESEKKKKELFDDSDKLEEEIERMSELHQGLRNKDDVLNMCRLMVRAEDPEHRLQILRVLENTEQQGCLRLFLDYHGLPLVWCWMADAKLQVSDLKHIMLKVLKKLPITNKTILEDSKILEIVKKWSEPEDTLDICEGSDVLETSQEITDTDNTENDEESMSTPPVTSNKNPVSILASIRDKKSVKKSVKFAEVESSSDSESRASASESDLPGDSVEGDVTSSSQSASSSVKTRRQLRELRRRVLEKDSPDIKPESVSHVTQSTDADSSSENQSTSSPKDENIEESEKPLEESSEEKPVELSEDKTIELSEESEPESKSSAGISEKESEELEQIVRAAEIKNLATDLLEHWSTLKEIYKIPKKQVLEERKKTERELDSNYEKIALIEERKKKVSGWDTVKGRKRKREASYKEDTDDSDSNNPSRKALLQTPPKMSKSERRQLFEAQVKAQDELAAEYQRHQEQMQQEQYEQEQLIQQQHQRQLMQDPGFWYYATQDPNFLPSIGIDPQQFLQQLAMDPVLLQQLMGTIPNFQQQLEHLTFMYQQAVLQASQFDMSAQPEPMPVPDENEPMTEQHMAFLQQVEAFKQQHLEPSKSAMPAIEEEDIPPPPSPPKGKAIVLPPNWKTAKDAEGKLYYYHTVTRQTQWDPPNIDTGEHADDMDLGTPTQDDTVSRGDQKEEKEKTTTAAADTSSETNRKLKEQFKTKMSSWIVLCLNPFRKPDCKLGRVSSTEDFKHLARKLTHHVMAKELKHCRHVEDLEVNENVKSKAKDFVKKYMTKFGASYKRSGNSPTYE